jgi:uncharacterized protein (TIGR03663 family)
MSDETATRRWTSDDAFVRRLIAARPALAAVLAVTALSVAARLAALGARVMHWDEGRVGYAILRYAATGHWEYRAEVHGPFLYHVNAALFDLVGASDFVARLPVAVVGGLLPLVAWLLHDRLRDEEMVGMALLLAANPTLLYYSRFMRNDVLVAGFALFAFGFLVRAVHQRSRPALYAGVGALALAFTTKENALIYVGTWVGALALCFDHRLFLSRARERDALAVGREYVEWAAGGLWAWRRALVVALVEFLVVIVVFYAPRPEFGRALTNPAMLPGVVEAATVGAWQEFYGMWVSGGHQGHAYLPYFTHYVEVLRAGALPVVLLAVGGFLLDRYGGDRPRDVVAFAAYWGFVSVLIYPLVTDIQAPWNAVHTVAPLTIPAAIGLGAIYRRGRDALAADDRIGVGLAAVVLLVVAGMVVAPAAGYAYVSPQDRSVMVQYGQPTDDFRPAIADAGLIASGNDGPDVLYYGAHFIMTNESTAYHPPAGGNWYNRLPMPWYTEMHGVEPTSATDPAALDDPPPVVITTKDHADLVGAKLEGYSRSEYLVVQDIPGNQVYVVVYVDEEALQRAKSGA